ncbi:MAG: glycoside hydrolase family 3 C-terminal domain-containing protein [Clostridiales bacterium]|jgi:beta-glucosidase|nr:glycoside hydrolase family 3 C-terminal domain-containing protein [Clostridiales bacterium]
MEYKELIGKMTLEEKASMLSGKSFWETKDYPEYGIPSMFLADGPHGVRRQVAASDHLGLNESMKATCFPTAATVANSWDPGVGEELAACIGREAAKQKVNVLLGPGLNIKRNPLCGRNFEYFSEDPYLAGKMAAAYARGIQSAGVAACPKHFAANNQESRRMVIDSVVDERALREIYLTPFEMAVKEGGAKTVMSSYNKINGTYANENAHVLKDILRGEWGFKGVVVTDWGGSNDRVDGFLAGNELEMPSNRGETNTEIVAAVKSGRVSEAALDAAVERLLTLLYGTGEALKRAGKEFDTEAHHAAALRAAEGSAVLLKNDGGVLPLKKGVKVAVIGDFAKNPRFQGAGSSVVNPTKLDAALGLSARYGINSVGYAPGFKRYGKKSKGLIRKAVKLAQGADVALLYIGLDEVTETEGIDRADMRLPENQRDLIAALKKTGKKTVAVLSCGVALEAGWVDGVDALLHAYLGGQAGAAAVLNLLTGKANPSGKLAESYPYSYGDCSSASNFPGGAASVEYRESVFVGYRHYDAAGVKVRFPFGYGMSYTSFGYGGLTATGAGVKFTLKNTGAVAGAEIAQLYVGAKNSKIFRPKKELKGFKKVFLQPGESREVEIPFDEYTFRYFNVKTNRWETEPGEYEIAVGASSADIRLTASIRKEGESAPAPYAEQDLPAYYKGSAANVGKAEFEKLLGRETPEPGHRFIKKNRIFVDANTAIYDLKYAKGWAGRFFARALQFAHYLLWGLGKRKLANVLMMGVCNMPLRGLARMSGGMICWGQLDGLITIFNGKFFKGLHKFRKEGKLRKKREKAAKRAEKEKQAMIEAERTKILTPEEIGKQIKPLSKNGFLAFFQRAWRGWKSVWYGFSDKHPKLAKLIYQIVFFIIFSEGVTIYQYLVTLFLPMAFGLKLAEQEFLWPNIFMYNAGGQAWSFNLLGYAVVRDSAGAAIIGGGLGYFIAFELATFTAQIINFPLQRNITFRSHGNAWWQAMWYLIGWVLVSLFCNGVNSLWMPLANGAVSTPLPAAITNIITMIIMGGIAMVIFFFIFKIIFPDYNAVEKRLKKKAERLKSSGAPEKAAKAEAAYAEAVKKAKLSNTEKAKAKTAAQASAKAMAYFAAVKNAERAEKAGVGAEAGREKAAVCLRNASAAAAAKDAAALAYDEAREA